MKLMLSIIYFLVVFKFVENEVDPYITGGYLAKRRQYPHTVYLIINCKFKALCGGSILNQYIVLTAAHCMERCVKIKSKSAQVRYGHEDIHKMKRTAMEKYLIHEEYDEIEVYNDICMMMTKHSIRLSKDVKRVIIMRHPPVEKYAFVSGWGMTEDGDTVSKLKYTQIQLQSTRVCAKLGVMPLGTFCAGPIMGLGTVAMGDSGGPLVIQEYIQIGVVSYSVDKYSLGAYTNVSYHLPWIQKNSKRLYCARKKGKLPAYNESIQILSYIFFYSRIPNLSYV